MRKLASVQAISDIQPMENADSIECATVLGWKVVVKKGEFKVGEKCVYCEVDSILPPREEFDFLAKVKYRIRTIRLRGQISQGICFPLSILPQDREYEIGEDVTELLGVVKYEPPAPRRSLGGDTAGPFPSYVPKTDEPRIQSVPHILSELKGVKCVSTVKVDGTSATFCRLGEKIDVCSRTRSVKPVVTVKKDDKTFEVTPVYWLMYNKYDIGKILKENDGIAIQGEIAGFWDEQRRSLIQGNKLKLKETELFVFNVFDIKEQRYFDHLEMVEFCHKYGLQHVPIDREVFTITEDTTVDALLKMAEGSYPNGGPREGIVIRPLQERYSDALKGRASFKAINNKYLLKHGG